MKTVFIRAIEAPVDEKAAVILSAVREPDSNRFDVDLSTFQQVPRSPFAYWVSDGLRKVFISHRRFDARHLAIRGAYTTDDFRYYRLIWEVPVAYRDTERPGPSVPLAKGGAFSPFYADIHLAVRWSHGGHELKALLSAYRERKGWGTDWSACLNGYGQYFRPGLTWPRRTNGLSFRLMPTGCIFADKGPAAFVEEDDPRALLGLCAVLNSSAFGALVAVQLARTELAQSFEVGLIQQTPIPDLQEGDIDDLAERALRSWSLRRRLDSRTENSHAFLLPALLQVRAESLIGRAEAWVRLASAVQTELDMLGDEIDDRAFRLYRISAEDRRRVEHGFGPSEEDGSEPDEDDGDGEEVAEIDAMLMVASLLFWSIGVAFGRFDVRLATGQRPMPPEPEPFDALPVCSPGMLAGADGLPAETAPPGYPLSFPTDGILVDDKGHPRDLVGAIRSVFDAVFDDANNIWHEAAALLGSPDIRHWFAREFFEQHIKRYSKSRRKAPIYWQLSTPSGSYSVWLYIHRATSDTLFRVLNDFVGPKLDHETRKLAGMTREAGANPSAAQRRELDRQDTFVTELQGLRAEIARVAPLWRPDLDDGVILNFAPLWRLVPQSRGWQTECRRAWEKLASGDYDWAHLAMHLWPERVVPKCIDDRSLAIAHGVEEVFWYEDDAGAWQKRQVQEPVFRKLVTQWTSATVKAALKDLLSAPTPTGGSGAKTKSARPASRQAATRASAASSPQGAVPSVDDTTLESVRAAIAKVAGGASKADVLGATGLSESDWNKAIAALLGHGEVSTSGQKRGTRYHASARGEKA